MPELTLISAFLAGLLGGGHCIGMCGGIVGAVTLSFPGQLPKSRFVFSYNAGRLTSYTLAGFLAGALGASGFFLHQILPIEKILYGVANLMLILLGLYLAGFWQGILVLEKAGSHVWRNIQPLTKKLLPLRSTRQAFALGLVWGWLPCGLVYSILVVAISSGSATQGALLMLAFGLGTLPTLLAMGMSAVRLKSWLQNRQVRQVSGLIVIGLGGLGLFRLLYAA